MPRLVLRLITVSQEPKSRVIAINVGTAGPAGQRPLYGFAQNHWTWWPDLTTVSSLLVEDPVDTGT